MTRGTTLCWTVLACPPLEALGRQLQHGTGSWGQVWAPIGNLLPGPSMALVGFLTRCGS